MKIAFIGNFEVDFSSETHYRKTFEKLGHTVIRFQENATNTRAILKQALNCDMLFWVHTHSWRIGTNQEISFMLNELKKAGVPTVGYHLDLFMGLQRERDLKSDSYWNIEHFFTVDKLMADWLNSNTSTKGYYLPPGVFEDECIMVPPDYKKYPHEVVFTGSKNYHNEYKYRGILIDWLHGRYGENFAHYGSGGRSQLRGFELNKMYSSAKVVIGDTLCKNFTYPFYYSDRLTEAPGRGAFMIFPYIKGVEDMYEIGKELVTYDYNNFAQLKEKIDYYLTHDQERETIREASFERASISHTYTKRLNHILNTLCP